MYFVQYHRFVQPQVVFTDQAPYFTPRLELSEIKGYIFGLLLVSKDDTATKWPIMSVSLVDYSWLLFPSLASTMQDIIE